LPQTTINKAINDLRKRLNAWVSADGGQFEHTCIMWTMSWIADRTASQHLGSREVIGHVTI